MQWHLHKIIPHNGMQWVNTATVLYFLHLHNFYITSVFRMFSVKIPSPHEILNLITYLWLVGKNVVKVSFMYKYSLRLWGFTPLFPYYSNVFLRIVWLNILAKYTFIHASTTKIVFKKYLSMFWNSTFHSRRLLEKYDWFLKWHTFRFSLIWRTTSCGTDFSADKVVSCM